MSLFREYIIYIESLETSNLDGLVKVKDKFLRIDAKFMKTSKGIFFQGTN